MRKIDSDFDKRIKDIIAGMSLADKINSLTSGPTPGQPDFSIGGEGAHGVQARHDQYFDKGNPEYTTVFPNPIGLSSTWDIKLAETIGDIVGTEARSLFNEGLNRCLCLWTPTVDMERDPRWGRTEEGYGEDPYLTSEMAGHYILGMKGKDKKYIKCGATLKHFYGNNTENGREYKSSDISERLKWEYYLDVYRRITNKYSPEGIMTAYNLINGIPGIINPEIKDIADKWNITYVVSDGMALHFVNENTELSGSDKETAALAVKAGLDIFADDNTLVSACIRDALEDKLITEEDIDKCIYNKLAVMFRVGIYDRMSDDFPYGKADYNMNMVGTAKSKEVSRTAAAESAVLLKNKNGFLPLNKEDKIAVLGCFSDRCPLDWYSGMPDHMVTLFEGLKDNDASDKRVIADDLFPEVLISTGEGRYLGLSEEVFLIEKGNPVLYTKPDHSLNRQANRLVETDIHGAEKFKIMLWNKSRITLRSVSTGKLLSTRLPKLIYDGVDRLNDSDYLYVITEEVFSWFDEEVFYLADENNEIIEFDEASCVSFYTDSRIKNLLCWNMHTLKVSEDGYIKHSAASDGALDVTFEAVTTPKDKLELIKNSGYEKTVMAFGIHPMVESREGYDRDSYELSPYQRYLVNLITQSFSENALVLLANAPVGITTEEKNDKIKAILWSAFGSSEIGNGLADVIYGRKNPSGRTGMTWYKCDADIPDIDDYDIINNPRTYIYYDGDVLYPFGYGLSYSEIDISGLNASYDHKEKVFNVEIEIKNKSSLSADYVIPVFFKKGDIQKKLCFFTKLHDIAAGQTVKLSFVIPDENMLLYDEDNKKMMFGSGLYKIIIENTDVEVLV